MNRNRYTVALLLAVGLVVVGVYYQFGQGTHRVAGNLPTVTLRLKWLYDPGFAGEMVAAKAGLFEKYGINVDIKPGGFESDPIKLVASGADNIGVAGADSFLIARSKGVPIVAFALGGYLETGVAYYVHADSGIDSPKDFIGKKVGYQAGQDTATIYYEALMRKLGVDRAKITEVPVKFDFTPFLQKQVDVWPGYAATQAYILEREKVPYKQFLPADSGISFIGTVYFTTEAYMAKNPKVIEAFTKGLIDGWDLTYGDYAKSLPMIESYDPAALKPDLIKFNLDKQKSSILPPGFKYAQFQPKTMGGAAADLARCTPDRGANRFEKAVTYRFLETVYPPQ